MSDLDDDKIKIPIYELQTTGSSVNGWMLRGQSKLVFLKIQEAVAHIPEFEEKWYDKTQFECAEKGTLKTEIVEKELIVSVHTLERILQKHKDDKHAS